MSIAKNLSALVLVVAGASLASSAFALPVGSSGPLPEAGAKIEKVERVCRDDGYCYNKYTGAPMRPAPPRYRARPQYYADPYYAPAPRYVQPRPYYRRDYY
jgi:hypothetical protein